MSQTRMVLRVNKKNEEIDKGLFLRVCIEVDLIQSLKSEFKYYKRGKIK